MTRPYDDEGNPGPVEPRCTCGPTSSGPCRFCDGSDDPPVDEERDE